VSCSFELEKQKQAEGVTFVAGVDEAGRGPLAGPVVAAAVVFTGITCLQHAGLDDSKKLSPARRDQLYASLTADPNVLWKVGLASVEEIDRLNILRATHLAMKRAVESFDPLPQHALVDGLPVKEFPIPHTAVVGGDAISLSIAAASIFAKVTRDRLMVDLDAQFPGYGFAKHKGYGTKAHCEAIRNLGPCPAHRHSFSPVTQRELF
jgi:ribonuclease HII